MLCYAMLCEVELVVCSYGRTEDGVRRSCSSSCCWSILQYIARLIHDGRRTHQTYSIGLTYVRTDWITHWMTDARSIDMLPLRTHFAHSLTHFLRGLIHTRAKERRGNELLPTIACLFKWACPRTTNRPTTTTFLRRIQTKVFLSFIFVSQTTAVQQFGLSAMT